MGVDIDTSKVDKLNSGLSYIEHIACEHVARARNSGFEATCDFRRVSECDALILCVPTPLNKYREPDMSFVIDTTDAIKPYLRVGQIVSLESTTYPGTTEEELLPRVQESGLVVGESIYLVYSPEREDPGNPDFTTRTIPKVCGGVTTVRDLYELRNQRDCMIGARTAYQAQVELALNNANARRVAVLADKIALLARF